jgi:hypothetical protein
LQFFLSGSDLDKIQSHTLICRLSRLRTANFAI